MSLAHFVSPNFGPRRGTTRPAFIVLHYTAMESAEAACRVLCNPELEVSAHYLIGADGEIAELVPEDQRAWHAGAGQWGDITDMNSHSIGIEIANTGFTPFAHAQMEAVISVVQRAQVRWNIPAQNVIGHSDLAPGRKIDPGKRFDWARLAREGCAIEGQSRAEPVDEARFFEALHRIGYRAEVPAETLLAAFRLRHNPGGGGAITAREMGLATDLAKRFPWQPAVDDTRPLT